MNKNKIIIGGAALVLGGAIATGVILNIAEQASDKKRADNDTSQKIEELDFKDFEDEEKFSFCQGVEEIKGVYSNLIFGNEKGDVEYTSNDISVFDKERNKLYILGRRIEYKYLGDAKIQGPDGQGTINIEENGVTTEYYNRNSAPVRIDYNAGIINPAPERKNNDWVTVKIKSVGTLMGFTEEREDEEVGDAKVFCSSFSLDGATIFPDYFSFNKICPDHSPNPGVKFSGNFKFECGGIDNEKGIEILKEYQMLEKSKNEFDLLLKDNVEENVKNDLEDFIKDDQADKREINDKLQQLRDEMKASDSIK